MKTITRIALLCLILTTVRSSVAEELDGTIPLTMKGDIAAQLVDGVDAFLLRQLDESIGNRAKHWRRDASSAASYSDSLMPNRQRLMKILGADDQRIPFDSLEFVATTSQPQLIHETAAFKVYSVRWPVFRDVHGEGLWLVPNNEPIARVVAIPDADQTPETICGLGKKHADLLPFARQLAQNGCEVLVPTLIDRGYKARNGHAKMTNREFLYRSAFVLGKHLVGYEVQKVLAAVDWLEGKNSEQKAIPTGVIGYGEGGMIALYASALDTRIDATCVSGYFGSQQTIWKQPISRNVFGLLEQFGDAELASMIAPRRLTIDSGGGPRLELPSEGGAPATLTAPTKSEVSAELERLQAIIGPLNFRAIHTHSEGSRNSVSSEALATFWSALTTKSGVDFESAADQGSVSSVDQSAVRHARQFRELEQHNQWLLDQSASVRRGFMNLGSDLSDRRKGRFPLDVSSLDGYAKSVESYRDYFREEVIGHFDMPLMEFGARSRKVYDEPKWTGYEVVLDVFPDVIAYGVLCLPKGMKPDEKRPVVVCQHGLEGRPQDTIEGDHRAYHDFAAKLAERGYITFAPQNLYIGEDRFRTLQRKANPLKKTLFSVMVPQHQQIVNWLKTHRNVDAERIAFYGLSYGGKSAMRIPPLVPDYCLSICSGDFNEWVDKNASTQQKYSYVWHGEYEIFEFDLGSTFNYAEMAALIAPRPFMVERGHFDTVGTDENIAHEFAKVRFLYAAKLGVPERCKIEWFVGPHTINGKGTFEFLDQHLDFESTQKDPE